VSARHSGDVRSSTVIVGFAAETGDADGDVLTYARAKLERKGCDLLVVNAVGDGKAFEVDHNDGWLLGSDGSEAALGEGSKALLASRVLDSVAQMLRSRDTRPTSDTR
jgi:phosphopantothenoylcysteine decarboxylase/phosphopantothenate--cysteine ligase